LARGFGIAFMKSAFSSAVMIRISLLALSWSR